MAITAATPKIIPSAVNTDLTLLVNTASREIVSIKNIVPSVIIIEWVNA